MKIPSVKNQNLQAGYRRVMLQPALMPLREEIVWGKAILPTFLCWNKGYSVSRPT